MFNKCEELIVKHCSPTLAGLKTGNVFSCPYVNEKDLLSVLENMNSVLNKKGIKILLLRYKNQKALIYVFRPNKLKQDFLNQTAVEILKNLGYCTENQQFCLNKLIERLNLFVDFPHEIGLFLGYPPEDVKAFIEEGPDKCKICGVWKVYNDVENSQKIFKKYKMCTRYYCKRWEKAKSIERLAVASV